MKHHLNNVVFSLFFLLSTFVVISVYTSLAMAVEPISGQTPLKIKDLQQQRLLTESIPDISPDTKKLSLELIYKAMAFLTERNHLIDAHAELLRQIQIAPSRLSMLKKALLQPGFEKDARNESTLGKMEISALELLLRQEEARIVRAQTRLIEQNKRVISEQIGAQKDAEMDQTTAERLRNLGAEIDRLEKTDLSGNLERIRWTMHKAEKEKLAAAVELNKQKKQNQTLLFELSSLENQLAQKQLEYHEKELAKLKTAIADKRLMAAAQDKEDAIEAAETVAALPGTVQEQFDINLKLSAELEQIGNEESRLLIKSAEYKSQFKQMAEAFETASKRLNVDLLTETIGLSLRNQRRHLPSESVFAADSKNNRIRISRISERQFQLEIQSNQLTDPSSFAQSLMTTDLNFLSNTQKEHLLPKIKKLAAQRLALIQKINDAQERVIRLIQEIEYSKKQVIEQSEAFGRLLDRHLLWIRSSKPLDIQEVGTLLRDAAQFFQLHRISQLKRLFFDSLTSTPMLWVLASLLFSGLIMLSRWSGRMLPKIADAIDHQSEDSILLTLQAVAMSVFRALPLPFLLIFPVTQLQPLHTTLTGPSTDTIWVNSGIILCFYALVYQLLCPKGPIQSHFRWPEHFRHIFRTNLSWLITVEAVCFILLAVSSKTNLPGLQNPFEIPAIMIQSLALLIFISIVTGFKRGIFIEAGKKEKLSLFYRYKYLWRFLLCLMPLCILWLAGAGFYFSALEIRILLHQTIALFLFIFLFNSLGIRMLLLARRKISLKKAMNRLENEHGKTSANVMDTIVKLSDIDDQTRSLLKLVLFITAAVGIWLIWEAVFPAFGILNDIQFWQYTDVTDGIEKSVPITLADVFIAAIVIAVTIMAVRNLPGLLEIVLLNRIPMDAGARYAYTTVSRYLIIAAGVFAALNSIGIRWSNLQWLVAALSVGLGFGLQEIVANFISGLIVLFERPFRMGDTVTVGDVTGTVTRIKIRATTIMDWDRKELIVPNKEFITGRLVNWSLSDHIIRIKIPVGIAYGSDTQLAETLMMDAVKRNELVVNNPKPSVVFLKFGDNSLEYEVRVFIKDIDDWVPMLHRTNRAIDEAFRKNNISISFPQRDVHLDAVSPIPVRMVSSSEKGA